MYYNCRETSSDLLRARETLDYESISFQRKNIDLLAQLEGRKNIRFRFNGY